nr:hypothetical protein [Tanacetum cinerariifolium]
MWEEFTHSIHSFVKDKKNLALHTQGKKKANLIMIPSIRFTKLIYHHLQSKNKFHSRLDSPLHLPYEEYMLGYLKFSAKGTKREVFGMPISNELIIADIQEVQGKGKEKVSDEQVALNLLTLQTPKKLSPAEQYIFQRRTPAPTEPSGHAESPSIYAKLHLTDSDTGSDEEGSPVVRVGAQDEGQAGPNRGVQTGGQAGSNPGDDAEPQPQSSHVVHAGPNLKHMDLEATDVSTQRHPEQIDEGFTATAYPNVQENLKLTVKEQVILEEPASSTGTLSSLQHLAKDFSFGNLFFNDKPSEAENEKTTAETKA